MSEIEPRWAFLKLASKDRRRNNRENSAQILRDKGIVFESKNRGAHLIIAGLIDFWPGTGKFIVRKTQHKGRGVYNVLRQLARIEKEKPRNETNQS